MDYALSDTHFNHKKIIEFERVRFSSIEEHDDFIMSMIESYDLQKDDVLYHLGDVGNPTNEIRERWKKLKCKKILIRGNHDKSISKIEDMFDEISSVPKFYNQRVVLSHYPIPVTPGTLNIHGHLHNSVMSLSNYINLSIHQYDYRLFNLKHVGEYLSMIPKDNLKFMKEWFAPYYKFTDGRDLNA